MPSRLATDAQKLTEDLCTALTTHGPALVAGVRTATTSDAQKHGVDVGPLLAHVTAASRAALDSLVAADEAHELELGDDAGPREARDKAAAALSRVLVDQKRAALALFGGTVTAKLGYPAETPVDPAVLARTGAAVVTGLSAQRTLKPAVAGVATVQTSAWVEQLQGPLDALTAARADVLREEKEARATRTARDAAFEALNAANVTAAALTQALARLGGTLPLVAGLRGTLDRSGGGTDDGEPVDPTPVTG